MSGLVRIVVVVGLLLSGVAFGQTAAPESGPVVGGPAGNEHPESRALSSAGAELENPFGNYTDDRVMTESEKRDFAAAVDVSPLADLAVFHNGRVKIVDTLAMETVSYLTGRKRLELPPVEDGGDPVRFDPVFTMFDVMIDPRFYMDKPLIGVGYLPLREAYLGIAFPGEDQARTRTMWKKMTRVSPMMVRDLSQPIFDQHASEAPYREGITRVENALQLYANAVANLALVAPTASDLPWSHIAELDRDTEARVAARALAVAWRAGDADAANAAIVDLAAALPAINAEVYPEARRSLELAYNRSGAFEWGSWLYFFSLLGLVLAFGTGRKWLMVSGQALLVLAVAVHGAGFVARCVIAERFAIQNQFESMTGLSLFASFVGLGLMIARRQALFGAASAGVGFLVLVAATQAPIPGEFVAREAAILNTSVLLKYHVTTVLTSYGLITLGFVISVFYLAAHYGAKLLGQSEAQRVAAAALGVGGGVGGGGDGEASAPTNARLLGDLDKAQMVALQLAFWTLGVGTLLGAWWADHSWGRWWAFDPKETWALITWIVYLIVIHVRFTTGSKKGLVTAWLSVAGFIVMLWTYFGVNLLLPGLHAYA